MRSLKKSLQSRSQKFRRKKKMSQSKRTLNSKIQGSRLTALT